MKKPKWLEPILRFEQVPLLVALLVICVVLTIMTDGLFLTGDNISNVLRNSSVTLIAAMGMTVAMVAGQVDLSVGSLLAVVGVLSVTVYNHSGSVLLAMLVGVLVGIVIGMLNGLVVTWLGVNALVTTLGTMAILRGAGYLSTNAVALQTEGDSFMNLGVGYVGPVPIPVILAAVFVIGTYILLNRTVFGRYIYAAGGNPEAARSAGLPVKRIFIWSFVIVASFSAVSALIQAARLNSFQPSIGVGFELEVIAAVILGGTRLTGGEGTVSGTLIGVLILGVLANGLVLLNINSFWQDVVRGTVIIVAVAADEFRKRRRTTEFKEQATDEAAATAGAGA